MERCRRDYGDMFTIELFGVGKFAFVCDPALIKQVFTASPDLLRAGEGNAALEPVVGKRSLLLLDGRDHLRHRKLVLPQFHGERLRGYADLMRSIAIEEIETWPAGEPLPMQPRMQAITLEIILQVVFGMSEGERRERMSRLLVHLLEQTSRPIGFIPAVRESAQSRFSPARKMFAAIEAVDEALYAEIRRRRAASDLAERDDILSLLLQARDEDGEPLTDTELRDELITLLIAGHETTATALSWAWERLTRTPGALGRLASEAAGGETAYADAVVHETLRLRPPLPVVARMCAEPYELGGYELPAGTRIAPCIYLVHRRPDVYPDPYAFRPDRFLERGPETYTFLPFGGGIRRCVGASFALYEMRVVLQAVVERLHLTADEPRRELIRRRAIILAPARGGRVVATPSAAGRS
jgi:cytochrome P450